MEDEGFQDGIAAYEEGANEPTFGPNTKWRKGYIAGWHQAQREHTEVPPQD